MSLTTTRSEFEELLGSNPIVSVCRELFADAETPVALYRKFAASLPNTFLLESADAGGTFARFSFVGVKSFGSLTEKGGKAHWLSDQSFDLSEERLLPGGVNHLAPLAALEEVLKRWASKQVVGLPPLTSGLVGFIAWESVREIFDVESPYGEASSVPSQSLSFVSDLIVIDHHEGSVFLIVNVLNDLMSLDSEEAWSSAQTRLDDLQRQLSAPSTNPVSVKGTVKKASSLSTQNEEYMHNVDAAKEYVFSGDVSQVVVSQRFDMECTADALDVYRALRHTNPSPFLYLLSCEDLEGESLTIVGSSPEALITVADGKVITHPIAGSRPRGRTVEEDRLFEAELLADQKEISEHEMLVELSKLDLARFCDPHTVQVTDHMRIVRYSHVMHIVSTVEGELSANSTLMTALRATFPAGTLSGSPKPRALQIIDELEDEPRGVFGGVAGYFGFGGAADLAIAIRTATIQNGVASVQAGAGIVAGSVSETEELETRNKAAAPLGAIAIANALKEVK